MERFDWSEDLRVMVQWKSVSMVWGSVCNKGWNNESATVVCRQLAYPAKGEYNLFIEH